MPAWIALTADALNAYLVAAQLTALRTKALAPGQADPFTEIAPDIIRKVRSYIASNPANAVDADELTIPPELKTDVCYLILGPMLGRLGIGLTKDQAQQVEVARSTLVALRDKKLLVTRPADAVTPDVQGEGGVTIVSAPPREMTRESLGGLF
ncbi:hypothetical protein K0B96_06620 [Horticoccus luteus]|uniref:DUF1320 domain-containing protein n=1 Tax=Horticoccus luteus TaxID=2862869 RepID=A0A8F9TYW4_9BACT|nr:hypothetical protein [Horticoccus luteus]QYM80283.1 hypothetical protein K0B96_06620 [Horticoccus luteus]